MNKYIELYEKIRQDIIDGIYKPNTKIPSKRVTADNYGVSLITVEHAYELLCEEGYITPRERSGYFVAYDVNETDIPIRRGNLGAKNENPAGTQLSNSSFRNTSDNTQTINDGTMFSYNIYAKKARKVLTDYEEEILKKSPGFGALYLREAIAMYLERSRHIKADPSEIIVGSGAEYLYGLIVRALGRDKEFAIEDPSYQKIAQIYSSEGVRLDLLPLDSNGIKSSALKKTKADVLHITPYRSFPTGISATAAKKREYLEWSRINNGFIIEDDFESEFSPLRKSEETLHAIDTEGRVIYINTFSRTIGGAIRIAYMVIPKRLKPLFEEKVGFYNCTVPTFNQYILAEIINDGDFERHLNRVRRITRASK